MRDTSFLYFMKNISYQHETGGFLLKIDEFTIREGETLGIVGQNGSGKSTLLRMLALMKSPSQGILKYDGYRMDEITHEQTQEISFLPQNPKLLKRTVLDNIQYGLRVRRIRKGLKEKVNVVLDMVGLTPQKYLRKKWFELSGGERQRVALAARLVVTPRVLILDEPTSSIDEANVHAIQRAIESIKKEYGPTLIMTDHNLSWVLSLSNRVVSMHGGRIVGENLDNIIEGPWLQGGDPHLYEHKLFDGQKIIAVSPPTVNAIGMLSPLDVLISRKKPQALSARNSLRGYLTSVDLHDSLTRVLVTIRVSEWSVKCIVTHQAAASLGLQKGVNVWVVFKASSIRWV